jgi:hypothetical protein
MNYFIAPRSGEKSYKNFQSTLLHGVSFESISKFLDEEGKEKLLQEDVIYAWGNRLGTRAHWNQMEYGDTVIFYAKGELVVAGEIYYKLHRPELALAMWPPDENGNPWEFTFFIKNLRYLKMPIKAFNAAAGYKSNFIIQGFMQLKGEHLSAVETQYGSIEEMLNTFGTSVSEEIPLSTEKLYVNVDSSQRPEVRLNLKFTPKVHYEPNGKRSTVKKIDHVARNKSNAITGSKGEAFVVKEEQARLTELNRTDLAEKVCRVSIDDDSLGYDVLSYEADGRERYIEVKTSGAKTTGVRFFMSSNEMLKSRTLDNYFIYFVDGIKTKTPRILPITSPFGDKFLITTDTYILEADLS